jgi:hypothetical protein
MTREIDGGRLIGGSVTATSEALLGVLALQGADPSRATEALGRRTADLIAARDAGTKSTAPWGAHVDGLNDSWHAWGSRAPQALAAASFVFARPGYAVSARASRRTWTLFYQ